MMVQKKTFRFLSRLPEYSRFQYKPRHYDPDKEDLARRVKMAKSDREKEQLQQEYRIRDKFGHVRMNRQQYSRLQHQRVMSKVRFLIILNILLLLALYIFVKVL